VASGNPPVAIFTTTINGAKITVDAKNTTSDNNVTAYLWNFGDGSISTKISDTYTYTQSGTYYITLTVVDSMGLIDMETKTVEITAPATSTGNNWLGLILFLGIIIVFVYLAFFNKGGKGKGKGSFLGKKVKTPTLRSEPKQKPILVHEHYRKSKNDGGLL
jgi:PKD repeat protein